MVGINVACNLLIGKAGITGLNTWQAVCVINNDPNSIQNYCGTLTRCPCQTLMGGLAREIITAPDRNIRTMT